MIRLTSAILSLLAMLVAGCMPQTIRFKDESSAATKPSSLDYANYALVLSRSVRTDGVDYAAILADPAPLQHFLARIADIGPRTTPDMFPRASDRIAYDINAHNACILLAVIAQARDGRVPEIPPRDLSTGFRFEVDGRLQTPADLARSAMKESDNDWRVGLALCGGRRSDPPLAPRPFIGEVLNYQLTKNVDDGLTTHSVLWVDAGMQNLYVNRVLYDARGRLVDAYQKRTGARDATLLNVLLDLASRDRYPLLNSAVGYPIRPLQSNPTVNASSAAQTSPAGVFSRLFGI